MKKASFILIIILLLSIPSCSSTKVDEQKVNSLLSEATNTLERGEFIEAEKLFSKILSIDSTNKIALYNNILTLHELEMDNQALKMINNSISIYPNNLKFYLLKARLLKTQDQDLNSIEVYKQLLSKAEFSTDYHKEYLEFLMECYDKGLIEAKEYIIEESIFLIENSFLEEEGLIALCTVEKDNIEYSMLLLENYPNSWTKLFK